LHHRLEYRGEVAGRVIDDSQHFGCRGLLFQCLARLGDQPRVLHCDDRLRREILQQRDLLLGERPHLLAIEPKCAQELVVLAQCHSQSCSGSPQLYQSAARIGRRSIINRDIWNLHHWYAGSELIERTSRRDRIGMT
jgi:hypothetical protein